MDNKRRTRSVYRFDTEKERKEATRIKNKIYYDKNKIKRRLPAIKKRLVASLIKLKITSPGRNRPN